MTDFDHATDDDRARAKALAEAAGWRQMGFRYCHPTRGNYLVRDMDGWIDLCDNEGIEWEEPCSHPWAIQDAIGRPYCQACGAPWQRCWKNQDPI